MAKIGLNNFRYGIAHEDSSGALTYETAKKPGKAVTCSVSLTKNDASLYADDELAENDTSVTGGDITLGLDKLDNTTKEDLLGHDVSNDVVTSNVNDVAPYVGIGRIITIMESGVIKYIVKFLAKCKFSEPNEDEASKGENTAFSTYELPGKLLIPADGNWKKEKTFTTKSAAITYLESLFGTYSSGTTQSSQGSGTGN